MDDAQDQDHSVLLDHVVDHAVVAHTESVERVAHAADGLHRLAADPPLLGCGTRLLLQCPSEAVAGLEWQLFERSCRRRREPDIVGAQTSSWKLTVRPFA